MADRVEPFKSSGTHRHGGAVTDSGKAVFLSYASQDAQVAQNLCNALRAAGIEVWFDQSELRGGDAWDAAIRSQILACSLFVPIISDNTQARDEGYFRLEWKLAVDRSHLMAHDKTFLLPVVVDNTPNASARVPDKFREVQWTRLPKGADATAFAARTARLLSPDVGSPATPSPSRAPLGPGTLPQETKPRWILLALGAAALAGLGYLSLQKSHPDKPLAPVAQAPALARETAPGRGEVPEKSIAVLPFADLSEKKDQEYFSDGLSEELLDLLAQVPDLRVPARTSSFFFRGKDIAVADIAKALGVAHVLEGSVRKSGRTIRVSVQLIRADSGYTLWSKTYDRALNDVFKVQDEIANAVVSAMKIQLLPGQRLISAYQTTNAEAHDAFLLGWQLHFVGDADADRGAIAAFHKALAADPNYAPAYVGLGMATISLPSDSGELEAPAYAESAGYEDRAIRLDPKLSIAYSARGIFRLEHLDWKGARDDISQAVKLDSRDSQAQRYMSRYLATQGMLDEAVTISRRAIEIDPLDVYARLCLSKYLLSKSDYDGARAENQRLLATNPKSWGFLLQAGKIDLLSGRVADALAISQQISIDGYRLALEAMARHSLSQVEESRRLTDHLISSHGSHQPYLVAQVLTWRGETDQALEWLHRAYELRDDLMEEVKYERLLASLRTDPRFKALLRKMNLPE
jgi:TolB-like protein